VNRFLKGLYLKIYQPYGYVLAEKNYEIVKSAEKKESKNIFKCCEYKSYVIIILVLTRGQRLTDNLYFLN
jgi:hypothetical protein